MTKKSSRRASIAVGVIGLEISWPALLAALILIFALAGAAMALIVVLVARLTAWADPEAVRRILEAVIG